MRPITSGGHSRSPLRVVTYNIHGCVGTDRCFDPPRIQSLLARLPADVLALQEVETYHHGEDVLGAYQAATDWTVISGPTLVREQGHYGNALITRLPVKDYALIDLSIAKLEARSAIHALLDHEGARLEVVATHLGLRPAERRHQVRILLELLQRRDVAADTSLLLGDFNDWFLWGRPLRLLQRHFASRASSPATFPSCWPLFGLDRIWVSPPGRLTDVRVLDDAQARRASDHLPLIGEVWP